MVGRPWNRRIFRPETQQVYSTGNVGRIRILAGREGLEAEYLASPFPKKELFFPNLVREYLSYARTYLIGY